MSQEPIYVKIKDIQKNLDDYFQHTGKCRTFTQALDDLYHNGQFRKSLTKTPDYRNWDVTNIDMLWELYSDSQLNVHPILLNPDPFSYFVSEKYIGFITRDIIPHLHVHHEDAVLHSHDYFEINYVLKGSLNVHINLNNKIMREGDFCIISPQTQHSIRASDHAVSMVVALRKSTFQDAFFNILKSENLLSIFFKNCLYSSRQSYLLFNVPPSEYICEIIRNIFAESYSAMRSSNEIACNYLSILFCMILRTYSSTYLFHSDEHSIISQMPLILTYLKSNYKKITLNELADFWGYNSDYLGKQIYKTTGYHYNDIITKLKVDEAAQWLQYSNKKIEEIAEITGYNSLQHFSRAFRSKMGISPAAYRKEHRVIN